jgi:hypothetical protein
MISHWCVLLLHASCATNSFPLQFAGFRGLEIDCHGVIRRVAARPRAKRNFPEPLSEGEVLILGLLSLWRMSPLFIQQAIQIAGHDVRRWVDVAVTLWQSPIDISVKISMACCMRKVTEVAFMTPPSAPNYAFMVDIVKSSL